VELVGIENEEINKISKDGVKVPFMKPLKMASDKVQEIEVVLHIIDWLKENEKRKQYDLLMLLQPTSPLRATEDIDKAIELLFLKKAKAIVSVCEVDHHPLWANTLPEDGCMKDFIRKEIMNKNRQELPVFYRLNSVIYLSYCDYIKEEKSFFGEKTFAYIMPRERSIGIDNEMDLKLAQILIKNNISNFLKD